MARGRSRMVVGGGAVILLLCCCVGLLISLYVATQKKANPPSGNAYYNLATTPPSNLRNLALQGLLDDIFRIQSNCWAVNNWARTTMATLITTLDNAVVGASSNAAKAALATFSQNSLASMGQLSACPPGAWMIDHLGARYDVANLAGYYNNVIVKRIQQVQS